MNATKYGYECPECGAYIDLSLNAADAAQGLLKNYKGGPVNAGDAIILENAIRKCLIEELGVSEGNLK